MRSDAAIPRHWELGLGAFSLCWRAYGRLPTDEATAKENDPTSAEPGGKGRNAAPSILLAGSGKGVAGTLDNAYVMPEGVLREAPAAGAQSAA